VVPQYVQTMQYVEFFSWHNLLCYSGLWSGRIDKLISIAPINSTESLSASAWWRNGRASDLRSRGREFDPRPGAAA